MNINTVNRIYASGVSVTSTAARLPNIPLINNATLIAASGGSTVYVGDINVTPSNGLQLVTNAGVSLAVDNLNLLYVVTSPGQVGDLRWIAN